MNSLERIHDWLHHSRRKLATAGIAALAGLLAFHVVFGPNGMLVYHQKRTKFRHLTQEVEKLQEENQRLSRQIQSLKSDPRTIEKEAREQLRYARPGEVVYITPAPEPAAPPADALAKKP
ncbi:MAG: septum formation initiator family protein [Acidobacteria bacterium]|nr:septum formation initiator family protein [Acidobacteriota bacterium]